MPYLYILPKQQGVTGGEGTKRKRKSSEDHGYALPPSPSAVKAKLSEATARVLQLEREKKNGQARERRAKNNMRALLDDLIEKKYINEELTQKLESYSGKIKILLFLLCECPKKSAQALWSLMRLS